MKKSFGLPTGENVKQVRTSASTLTFSPCEVVIANMLANCCLFTRLADVSRRSHCFVVLFVLTGQSRHLTLF